MTATADKKRHRSASRGRRGSTHRTTLVRRRTYEIVGQAYSRLMYMTGNKPATIEDGIIPVGMENVFDRKAPTQVGLRDYAVVPAELKLFEGRKERGTTATDEDGRFRFTTELKPRTRYRLQAVIENGDRVFPERVTLSFKVRSLPDGLGTGKIKVSGLHEVKMDFRRWKTVDKERFEAVLHGGTLHFTGPGALVFNTFALEVDYLSQHLSPNLKRDHSNMNYHEFTYDGDRYRLELHHLCLSTCTTIMLRYHAATIKGREVRIEDVAEAAARYALDIHFKKMRMPDWAAKKHIDEAVLSDPKQRIVRFTNGEYPYNNMDLVLRGAERLMKAHDPKRKYLWGGGNENLCKSKHPTLTSLLGNGWPVMLADDLNGQWDHGRMCVGAVVDHTSRLKHLYVIDPSRPERRTIRADGSRSDLGWCIMCVEMNQSEITPLKFSTGGVAPAPYREAFW
jgi:hypothetical protein